MRAVFVTVLLMSLTGSALYLLQLLLRLFPYRTIAADHGRVIG